MDKPTFIFTLPAPSLPAEAVKARPRSIGKGAWLIGLGLLANAAVMLYGQVAGRFPDIVLDRTALGQAVPGSSGGSPMLGARGIYMMPAQLGPQTFGLYLMDVDAGTICVYRATPDGSRFRLMAARAFRQDSLLEDLNNDSPTPKDVQKLINAQKQRLDLQNKGEQPTVDQNPKPDENLPDKPPTGMLPGGNGILPPN